MFVKINNWLLNKSINKAGISEKIAAQQTISLFVVYINKIIGEGKARQARPLYVKNKRLIIQVENSLIAAEIKKHEQEILDYLDKQTNLKLKRLVFIS
ncbi:MAG: DciA family protein [Patescibacteria group bacterium]|jgi:hypothetical protein